MKGEINMTYIWYVGYGSNLHEQRFLCYITGGTPCFGKSHNKGCKDKTLPRENKPMAIHHSLYFALPRSNTRTSMWGTGGVAFIEPEENKTSKTLCRMWKITKEQYQEVREQEGCSWYGKEIQLGEDSGIPVYTITNDDILSNISCPSESYIKTIALGLKETYNFNAEEIADYLIEKNGIRGSLQRDVILNIIASL